MRYLLLIQTNPEAAVPSVQMSDLPRRWAGCSRT